ncbi:MAG TPA: zinc ribbon domain-containing protein [Propioniciclava sp.]|jgi:putative FmdB family regulatory protein|uniref:FmdB family zinc ribbon protein n=1 Tax=Propioniciclava sp. TaxID=2038686 RepID=UPI002B922E97|nr:FmdB family zinc ribbon protein [Propioniciclava sp.]HRL50523.1 zinc ribbon domain-containing protein [Propioniciclava sp.]HRL81049.1 zinc ribbon domain-containing protein [Propioniciclava sp.]
MPTYEYRCANCGADLEVQQRFTDDPLTVCPTCQGPLHKVFSAVGVVFKGSGFYATDNRSSSDKGKVASEKKASAPKEKAKKDTPATPSTGTAAAS